MKLPIPFMKIRMENGCHNLKETAFKSIGLKLIFFTIFHKYIHNICIKLHIQIIILSESQRPGLNILTEN